MEFIEFIEFVELVELRGEVLERRGGGSWVARV